MLLIDARNKSVEDKRQRIYTDNPGVDHLKVSCVLNAPYQEHCRRGLLISGSKWATIGQYTCYVTVLLLYIRGCQGPFSKCNLKSSSLDSAYSFFGEVDALCPLIMVWPSLMRIRMRYGAIAIFTSSSVWC